jgi:hypothetical protein
MRERRRSALLLATALTLGPGCGTAAARHFHRPPSPDEVAALNVAASSSGYLEVEYLRPLAEEAGESDPVPATVRLEEGRLTSADRDRLTFRPAYGPPLSLPTDRVRSVSLTNRRVGTFAGMGIGAAVALVLGMMAGGNVPKNCETPAECSSGKRTLGVALLFGVLTVPLGAVAGSAGVRERYVFHDPPTPPARDEPRMDP